MPELSVGTARFSTPDAGRPDPDAIRSYVEKEYLKRFEESPLAVKVVIIPGEVDVLISVRNPTDKHREFAEEIRARLGEANMAALVVPTGPLGPR